MAALQSVPRGTPENSRGIGLGPQVDNVENYPAVNYYRTNLAYLYNRDAKWLSRPQTVIKVKMVKDACSSYTGWSKKSGTPVLILR